MDKAASRFVFDLRPKGGIVERVLYRSVDFACEVETKTDLTLLVA